MEELDIGGQKIILGEAPNSDPHLKLTKNGRTVYGELSPTDPGHKTLKFQKNGQTLYLIDAKNSTVLGNSDGYYHYWSDWYDGDDSHQLGRGYYDNNEALTSDRQIDKPNYMRYRNERLIMNTSVPVSQFKNKVSWVYVAFDNMMALTAGGSDSAYLKLVYDWSRTSQGYTTFAKHPAPGHTIPNPLRYKDETPDGTLGSERILRFPTSRLDLNGGWVKLFETPRVQEGSINARRRRNRLAGAVRNIYYFRVRSSDKIEILIRSLLNADGDNGQRPVANVSGKLSALVWGQKEKFDELPESSGTKKHSYSNGGSSGGTSGELACFTATTHRMTRVYGTCACTSGNYDYMGIILVFRDAHGNHKFSKEYGWGTGDNWTSSQNFFYLLSKKDILSFGPIGSKFKVSIRLKINRGSRGATNSTTINLAAGAGIDI